MKGDYINMIIIKKIKYPLTIIIIITIIITCLFLKKNLNKNKYKNTEVVKKEIEEPKYEEKEIEKCYVDIKGAIKKPGVYLVDCNNTVNDIIKLADGLNNNADTSVTNLAKKVTNEMVIIIYTKEQVKNSDVKDTVVKVVEKECICPNIKNDGCINTKITSNIGEENIINNEEENGLININTATKDKLLNIPGIGESKANAIITYRETHGNFKTIEDIQNVTGIGAKLYEEIKAYITT